MRTLTKKIEKLGFPMVQDVAGMASIHVLIGTTAEEGRCGIYLLILASGEAYIGQSKNVVKRYCGVFGQAYMDLSAGGRSYPMQL